MQSFRFQTVLKTDYPHCTDSCVFPNTLDPMEGKLQKSSWATCHSHRWICRYSLASEQFNTNCWSSVVNGWKRSSLVLLLGSGDSEATSL